MVRMYAYAPPELSEPAITSIRFGAMIYGERDFGTEFGLDCKCSRDNVSVPHHLGLGETHVIAL
jgi:hypothetical protein